MNKRLLLFAAFLLAFILFGVIGTREKSAIPDSPEMLSNLQAEYDYYISGMTLDRFTPEGARNYRITADRVTHYPTGDYSDLVNPAMTWHEDNKAPWVLVANNGVLRSDPNGPDKTLELQNNVNAQTTNEAGKTLTITTESLNVIPASRQMNSAELVKFDSSNIHLSGTGMRADLAEDHIDLLSGVSGHYE